MTQSRGTDTAWTDEQVAEYLGLARQTLRNWRTQGGGPPFIKAGRSVRYRPDDVRQWQEDRVCYSTSECSSADIDDPSEMEVLRAALEEAEAEILELKKQLGKGAQ